MFVTMYGTLGKMTKRRLHTKDGGDIFARASEMRFRVYGPNIGDLVKCDVEVGK